MLEEEAYHNYSFINIEITSQYHHFVDTTCSIYHFSRKFFGRLKVCMFHLKNSLICFFLKISQNLCHLQISFNADWDQATRHRFVKKNNTHMSMSLVSYLNILTSSIKFSETVIMSSKLISNTHVLASLIYQDRRPRVQVCDHTFFLIRTSHNFIHHKSMKHLKDCTSIIDIVNILHGVFHRISKHVFIKKTPLLAITKYDTSTLKCLEREEVQCF